MHNFLMGLFLYLSFFIHGSASSWQEYWTNAVEYCNEMNYIAAEHNFNLAIAELERIGDKEHPHLYVDRARLYSLMDRDQEALADLNIARASQLLEGDDKLRAIVTRLVTYYRLNMLEESKLELEEFKSIYSIPKLEVYKDKVIIRNIPDCECAKKLLKSFIASVFCESEDDVKVMNGICIGTRKVCDCGCDKGKKDALISSFKEVKQSQSNSDCKWWCDKMQVSGNIFCAGTFKLFRCQAICIGTVELLKDGCYWCCNSGGIYKNCIKPFEDIVGRMGQGCDPAWD